VLVVGRRILSYQHKIEERLVLIALYPSFILIMTLKIVMKSILIVGMLTIQVVRSLLPRSGSFRICSVPNTAFVPKVILPQRSRAYNLQLFSSDPKKKFNFEELQRVASDAAAFEAYVLKGTLKEKEKIVENESQPKTNSTKKGYVPIEQWDKERSKDDMQWEERVQFDGQRFGNQFNQNEILRHNLKTW